MIKSQMDYKQKTIIPNLSDIILEITHLQLQLMVQLIPVDTNLKQVLNIKTGARVMITLNVNTTDSIVNRSLGVIEDIITDDGGKVKTVIIKFDVEKSGESRGKK